MNQPLTSFSTPTITLPQVRGKLRVSVSLGNRCWFGVGGAAEWLFTPEDEADLAHFLSHLSPEIPVTIIGVGSNLLVRDGGIAGIVIRLGRGFTAIRHENDTVYAGAAALDVHVAHYAAEAGLGGLEFLSGIPGTIGGAVKMNAGAYGREISDCAITIRAVDRQGVMHEIPAAQAAFSYRHSSFPEGWVVTGVSLQAQVGDKATILARMEEIARHRESSQPIRSKTGGSTFKNPEMAKAWQLIDAAGCRGLRRGDAQISELHCNFLINHGKASAADLELLGEEVRQRVFDHSGIMLEWEIKRVGFAVTGTHQHSIMTQGITG